MTIRQALDVSNRPISYRDAEVLLSTALEKNREWLHAHPEDSLTTEQAEQYADYLAKREQNIPVAYILGFREFYGRRFSVDERVLIPRPETEGAIEHALTHIRQSFRTHTKASNKPCPVEILELGTGCGNISVTLGLEAGESGIPVTITATDVSADALQVAEANWKTLNQPPTPLTKLHFLEASLFNDPAIARRAPYDLIIANLPYVSTRWKTDPQAQPDVVFHEPDLALFGGEDGLTLYRDFFAAAPQYLAEDGAIIIEYGEDQTPEMTALAQAAFPHKKNTVYPDYAGLDRILVVV